MFPRPTDAPAADRTKPILPEKELRFFLCDFIFLLNPPCFACLNSINAVKYQYNTGRTKGQSDIKKVCEIREKFVKFDDNSCF